MIELRNVRSFISSHISVLSLFSKRISKTNSNSILFSKNTFQNYNVQNINEILILFASTNSIALFTICSIHYQHLNLHYNELLETLPT